jgi:hypothetical protein
MSEKELQQIAGSRVYYDVIHRCTGQEPWGPVPSDDGECHPAHEETLYLKS